MQCNIILYAAVSINGVIGLKGGFPWRLSSDLKRFKSDTMGKPIIMGRKTWQSIGHPLPGRFNIVVSADPDFCLEGAEIADSPQKALDIAKNYIINSPLPQMKQEIAVIGGSLIFKAFMPLAYCLHITHVLAYVDGDTFFPFIDLSVWTPVHSEDFPEGECDSYKTRYVVYHRLNPV